MEKVAEIGQWAMENHMLVLEAVAAILGATMAVLVLIPGQQGGESIVKKMLEAVKKLIIKK